MQNQIHTRRLTDSDAEAFFNLRLQGLREEPYAFSSSYEEEAARGVDFVRLQFRTVHVRDSNVIFGAFQQDALVGVTGIFRQELIKKRHRAVLWGMYVTSIARGMGAGRFLCEAAIAHVRKNLVEVEWIDLSVESSNQAAKALYTSVGFKAWGTQLQALKLGGRSFDEDSMSLALT